MSKRWKVKMWCDRIAEPSLHTVLFSPLDSMAKKFANVNNLMDGEIIKAKYWGKDRIYEFKVTIEAVTEYYVAMLPERTER